jgi:hypothetical protein
MTKIKFTNTSGYDEILKPVPASTMVPAWYKETDSYVDGVKSPSGAGKTKATIKRCMPVFDAISAGYLILLPADVWVSIRDGEQYFEWANFDLLAFHPIEQAPLHPAKNQYAYPKWNNYWSIETPKGYSVQIIQPMHRESVFTILPGIVDTDRYNPPINFPMVINDPKFEGMIPKGTPIAQVIPFKRENWTMELGSEKDVVNQHKTTIELQTKFFDRYKSMFRTIKEYK